MTSFGFSICEQRVQPCTVFATSRLPEDNGYEVAHCLALAARHGTRCRLVDKNEHKEITLHDLKPMETSILYITTDLATIISVKLHTSRTRSIGRPHFDVGRWITGTVLLPESKTGE